MAGAILHYQHLLGHQYFTGRKTFIADNRRKLVFVFEFKSSYTTFKMIMDVMLEFIVAGELILGGTAVKPRGVNPLYFGQLTIKFL